MYSLYSSNAVKLVWIGVIWLAKVVTILELSASVKLELCVVMKVTFNVVASSVVSAPMTARDCGSTWSSEPSKAFTAAVRLPTELPIWLMPARTSFARSELALSSSRFASWGRAKANEKNGNTNRGQCILDRGWAIDESLKIETMVMEDFRLGPSRDLRSEIKNVQCPCAALSHLNIRVSVRYYPCLT